MTPLLAVDVWTLGLPTPAALAAVALIGYLFGRSNRQTMEVDSGQARRELKRAKAVIRQLESVARDVRRSLATHHASVLRFKDRIAELGSGKEDSGWAELCDEAERMLSPTLRLATQISHAYDEIRQQTNLLMTFTEVRTDPLTGLSNRRALDESLASMFSMLARYSSDFSLAIFDIDHFKAVNDRDGHLLGDHLLQEVARLFDSTVRDTDIVARYGGEEFVVLMPETNLAGASVFADRMRQLVEERLSVTVSGGAAQALAGDNPRTLLGRADAALYSAKASGRNCVYRHTGHDIERVLVDAALALEPPETTSQGGEGGEVEEAILNQIEQDLAVELAPAAGEKPQPQSPAMSAESQ